MQNSETGVMDNNSFGVIGALATALLDRKIDHFPTVSVGNEESDPASAENIMPDLAKAMAAWSKLPDDKKCTLDEALEFAKASLTEVKSATEYQDGKASRLLTVTSFVSALAGFLFSAFWAAYPVQTIRPQDNVLLILPAAAYLSFVLFVLSALGGAVTTFHATRTRFKYPIKPRPNAGGIAVSYLFHGGILGVTPKAWANSFVHERPDGAQFQDLKLNYFRNYVAETYLVAAKTADKLRLLQPAQSMLSWALRFLLLFATLFALSAALVPSTKPAAVPTVITHDVKSGQTKVVLPPTP